MRTIFICISVIVLAACGSQQAPDNYGGDADFLQKHKPTVELNAGDRHVVIVPSYQARVMTSTAGGRTGQSYGWINYELIRSRKYEPHINAVGGEERFWLGPEGGQFGLFFRQGQPFDFANWQTPAVLDTVSFDLVSKTSDAAVFAKTFAIQNYKGTTFDIKVQRRISLLEQTAVEHSIGTKLQDIKWVAYETDNTITNTGNAGWDSTSGVVSIWLLSMFKSSPENTILIPYKKGADSLINDAYFGKIPAGRFVKKDGIIFFKGDAKHRGKIGVAPGAVQPVSGSYDPLRKVLTIIRYDFQGDSIYANSAWKIQSDPFRGDVANAYNDGPNETGGQLGEFYELESSSPALFLQPQQSFTHRQQIYHFQGSKEELDFIAKQVLGVSLEDRVLKAASE